MNKIENPEDQRLNDLIYIGTIANNYDLTEVLSLTIEQYNILKKELEEKRLPWLN